MSIEDDLVEVTAKVNLDDPKSIKTALNSVLVWVEKRKTIAQQETTTATTAKPWSWVLGLVAAVLVFLALAFAAWQAWKKGREIAKLKHEIDKKKEEERKLKVNKELSGLESEIVYYDKICGEIQKNIDIAKLKIVKLEDERKAVHEKIDKITKWEDIDLILKR